MLDDQVTIPHEVVMLLVKHQSNLLGAWRRYREITLIEFGERLGINQAELATLEKADNPLNATLEKAAEILNCNADQLSD